MQMNSVWIPIGAYKIHSTANDMDTIGSEFQRGWYTCKHDKKQTNLLFCDMTSRYMKLTLWTFDCLNLISKGRKFDVM